MEEDALAGSGIICVLDDDENVRLALDGFLRVSGYEVRCFASPDEFLESTEDASCLILDVRLRQANGLEFQEQLLRSEIAIPVILMTGYGDIPMTVRGMKAGAVDFLPKPVAEADLLSAVREALARDRARRQEAEASRGLQEAYETLTPREREVMGLVVAGLMNKQVAARLELSEITVKIHRGNVMRKMGADSLADLVRMAELLGVRATAVSRHSKSG
ncbi:MAG: response regulator transcription factor [Acetobacteraceae bacterium]|nr:response regulator transcription factor [Acetobacteraceae bacterium]